MFICFICSSILSSINQLLIHLKIYHNLGTQSVYKCNQRGCIRVFQGSEKFRQHLNRVHPIPCLIHQDNSNSNETIPVFNLSEEVIDTNDGSRYFENIVDTNKIVNNKPYEDVVRNSALKFITNLYAKPNVTESLMQEIVDGTTDLFSSGIISNLKTKIMPHLVNCNDSLIAEFEKMFYILENPFLGLKTEYQRIKYFETNNLFFKPQAVVTGFVCEKKFVSGVERLIMVQVQAHLFPIRENLKRFFELPGVYDTVNQYTSYSENSNLLSSFLNGTTWKNIKKEFQSKIVFPIFLYFDDVEMGNPLGSHSGVHKMGCVYYTIPSIPPEYLSSLENIFPAFIFHSSDRGAQKINNKTMFSSIITELIDLEKNGISICVNLTNINVHFVLALVLGDNLGL